MGTWLEPHSARFTVVVSVTAHTQTAKAVEEFTDMQITAIKRFNSPVKKPLSLGSLWSMSTHTITRHVRDVVDLLQCGQHPNHGSDMKR